MSPFHAQMLRNSCFFWEVGGQIAFFPLLGINMHEIKAEKPVRPVPPAGLGALARLGWAAGADQFSRAHVSIRSSAAVGSSLQISEIQPSQKCQRDTPPQACRAPCEHCGFFWSGRVFMGQRDCEGPEETLQSEARDHKEGPLLMLAQC